MHGVAEECRVGKAGSDDVAWGNLDALHVHRLGLVQAELVQRLQDVNEFAAEPVLECDALGLDPARHQQYLFVLDVYALHRSSPAWKVKYLGFAEGLMSPELSWFSPFGLTASEIAAGVILCIFIYWGWDSCLAVTEETKDADKTPGRAALLSTVILLLTYLLVAVAIQAFAGFEETGIGLANEENSDDVLTIVGEPVLGAVMTSVLLLTVAVSAAWSTQTTILPTARGALAMAVYGAIPKRFAHIHPRYQTPSFTTMVMGITAIGFYLVLTLISANALADSIASLGLAVAFYYGITAFSCVWYFRRTLFTSARHFFMRRLLPFLGGVGMAAAFIVSAIDMLDPEYGFTTFGPIGGVFVIGVGMLALGVPLMIACAVRFRAFFRGETLNEDTPILVPDTGAEPVALHE
jgi:amino acid transporter